MMQDLAGGIAPSTLGSDLVTVEVAPGTRMLVVSDLGLAWRPTDTSQAIASEVAAVLDTWTGPGVLVFNGDVFDFGDDTQHDPGRIVDAHPRLAAALGRFVASQRRHLVVLAGTDDASLMTEEKPSRLLIERYGAEVGRAAELHITTGEGERVVRIEHGAAFGDNEGAHGEADRVIASGGAGLISGCTHKPELVTLRNGFYANSGMGGHVQRRHPGRLGLPAVFLPERTLSWVELEAGADLHVRLLYSNVQLPGASVRERLIAKAGADPITKPSVVASFPGGIDWPAPTADDGHRRRTRRIAGGVLAVTGLVNLFSAITPPSMGRLDLLHDLVPISVGETASALVAASGIALMLLSRGVRRGQRHAWALAVMVTAISVVLHVVKGLDVEEAAAAFVVLVYLLVTRKAFTATVDRPSIGRAFATLAFGGVAALVIGTVTALWIPDQSHMSVARAIAAVAERLIGVTDIGIPGRRDRFLAPALGGVGLALTITAGWLVFQPVVRRRMTTSSEWTYARGIVRRFGGDTLAYFALRDDKQHWFWNDTLIAYAVHNGVCLVSPDPIGPASQRQSAWRAFRKFADEHGWTVAVMGAGEEWLPIYRATGMRDLYVGDEAIVDVRRFNLDGGRMKGLRQAVNRMAKYGYRIEFHDPAHLPSELEVKLRGLMGESRRGEVERGFSMTLGRIFSRYDEGLLLAVCFGPDGEPAAFCQYVPAHDINGYSLDLMRRSESDEHMNGLTDFVVVGTIEYLREHGQRGLGLNFAVMRSVLAHETGDGIGHRIERWMLGWLSDSMQIESLWKYNAKFDPDWHPRYAVYDSVENFLTSAIAVAKAESFWELPLIGRFFAPDEEELESAKS
jgi:lysylphosphatidylglycerol synthetase-like protein (DUF2156 family)